MNGADFSRTCAGCGNIVTEPGPKGESGWHRCNAPGPKQGYTVSDINGRFQPYVPAWCPLMETEGGKHDANC